jgi:predicted metalloprotease with PDZ domain
MRYHLSCPEPATHLFHLALEVDQPGEELELYLPVWTPGSYLVREFARHLEAVSAADGPGRPLPVERLDKHRFRIWTGGAAAVTIRWRVYANELTVRTSHLDASHGFVSPAGVFLGVRGREAEPHRLVVSPPPGWQVATALEGGPTEFTASHYDELIDSPLELGTHRLVRFEALGVAHELAVWGRGNVDLTRLSVDLETIVETVGGFWGGLPYQRYLFILHLTGKGRGGLEHMASTAVLYPRLGFSDPEAYGEALSLLIHEFFHAWNVKRLRPAALTPYQYEGEQYTRLLWWFEGATSYYEQLLLARAGLLTARRYLKSLGRLLTTLARTPGAEKLTVEEASQLAWVKLYRPDENSGNSGVSYYLKGELVALALDLALRRAGHDLDGVMRDAYARWAKGGMPEDGIETLVAARIGEGPARALFDATVRGHGLPALDLELVGLALRRRVAQAPDDKGGTPGKAEERRSGWLGAEFGNGLTVKSVREGSPAWRAGLTADDELLAERGFRLDSKGLQQRLEEHGPEGTLRLTLFRRDELLEVEVPLAEPPEDTLWLEPLPEATPAQRAAFLAWSGAEWPVAGPQGRNGAP